MVLVLVSFAGILGRIWVFVRIFSFSLRYVAANWLVRSFSNTCSAFITVRISPMNIHTMSINKKKFPCLYPDCDKMFQTENKMQLHLKTHTSYNNNMPKKRNAPHPRTQTQPAPKKTRKLPSLPPETLVQIEPDEPINLTNSIFIEPVPAQPTQPNENTLNEDNLNYFKSFRRRPVITPLFSDLRRSSHLQF